MEEKQIVLKKVDVNALKELLNRGLIVNTVLDFMLSSEIIKSNVENDANTFWKEWETSTDKIFESEKFDPIEILIYNGKFFVDKILSYFSKATETTITIFLNKDNEPTKLNLNDNQGLSINMPVTRLSLANEKLSEEEHGILFGTENALASFDLPYETLLKINALKSLSYTSADVPAVHITFKAGDGVIRVFDGTFDLVICKDYTGAEFEVKIDKRLLSLNNSEDHTIYLCPTEYNEQEFDRFVFISKHSSIKSADVAILMKDMDTLASADDSDGSESWNW